MDSETGEILFTRSDFTCQSNCDLETGELIDNIDETSVDDVLEQQQKHRAGVRKSRFNVPKALIQEPECENQAKFDCYLSSQDTFTLTNKKRVIDLKEVKFSLLQFYSFR